MNVLLLREPSEDGGDLYQSTFQAAGYNPISLPVLDTVYENLSLLSQVISQGPDGRGYKGVVITSKRSCEAWREAQADIGLEQRELWTRVPFYVVGEGTATALQEAFSGPQDQSITLDIRGQQSGNAAVLAPFILQDVKQRPAELLYLSGDKNRDTIPRLLKQGGIELHTIQVYSTQCSPSFGETLNDKISKYSNPTDRWWIACFAPSSTVFAFPFLERHFSFKESDNSVASGDPKARRARIAAIGPTTKSCLEDDLSLHVDVTASRPTAEGLLAVIQGFENL